jgi:hypothetical protein
MKIYCCECKNEVNVRLTDGKEIYPHAMHLKSIPFWICDKCKNYVGTHHKTEHKTRPLGVIPTKEIREIRKRIHNLMDKLWKSGMMKRKNVYREISGVLGYEYHTAEIKTIEEGNEILRIISEMSK